MIPSQANSVGSTPQFEEMVHPFITTALGSEVQYDSSVASSPIATPGNEYKYTSSRSAPLSTAVLKDMSLLTDEVLHTSRLNDIRNKKGFIIDMDGVIYHVSKPRESLVGLYGLVVDMHTL
jgi:hypothetical protein